MVYVIWSWEHKQWWAPNRRGYTSDIDKAGGYTFEEAADVALHVIPPGTEIAMPYEWAKQHGPPERQRS